MIVSWCNGSTAVFGSACLSSNLGETTITTTVEFQQWTSTVFSLKISKTMVLVNNNLYCLMV